MSSVRSQVVAARAWPRWLRATAVALQAVLFLNLLEVGCELAADLALPVDHERLPLPLLVRRVFFFTALPALLFALARAHAAARVTLAGERLLLSAGAGGLEVPLGSVAGLRPWRLPLPEPGFSLWLRSGRRLPWSLSAPDPTPLARQLVDAASLPRSVLESPELRDASVRRRWRALHHPALKLGLLPAAIIFLRFRLHQLIAFGGLLGEAQSRGFAHWGQTLLGVALLVYCQLLALAALCRAATELLAWPAARLPPPWAGRARAVLEWTSAAAYYGGIALVLYLRLSE